MSEGAQQVGGRPLFIAISGYLLRRLRFAQNRVQVKAVKPVLDEFEIRLYAINLRHRIFSAEVLHALQRPNAYVGRVSMYFRIWKTRRQACEAAADLESAKPRSSIRDRAQPFSLSGNTPSECVQKIAA